MEHTESATANRALLAQLLQQKAERSVTYEPLSIGQRALWLEYQLAPQGTAYNTMYRARLQPGTDEQVLRRAFELLQTRHPVLRSNFLIHEGIAQRKVVGFRAPSMNVIDARHLDEQAFHELLEAEADTPFDLTNDPLLRISLYQRADGNVMALTLHHIATDFWSVDILLNELAISYQALSQGQAVQLPPLESDYRSFTDHEAQMAHGASGERLAAYWLETLGGNLPVLDLPTDYPRRAERGYRGTAYAFLIDARSNQALRELGQALGVTTFTLLLALYQTLLSRYTGATDLIIGSPMTSRTRSEWERILGYFVNLVALRVSLSGNPTFEELVRRVQNSVLGALEHREYPFPLLVETLQPKRDPSRAPIFQACFVWDQLQHDHVADNPVIAETLASGQRGAIFDFVFTIHESKGALRGTCEYDTDLFSASTVARMVDHYLNLIQNLASDSHLRIFDAPILSEEEHREILYRWNDTAQPFNRDICMHQLFEQTADAMPSALAVVGSGMTYTYAELEAESNRLAQWILAQTGGVMEKVAICLDRSPWMVVAVLATHKAGCSYVPLDADWPVERLAMLLEQPELSIVLTNNRLLGKLQQVFWRVPNLAHLMVLDVKDPQPVSEPLQTHAVEDFWDHVVDSAQDEISAGGFISAYTGLTWAQSDVDAYVDRVDSVIRPHLRPNSRVLEIGCGAGHITFRLAPKVESWLAMDPSSSAQRHNRDKADRLGMRNLTFELAFAHDIERLQPRQFDVIVMASVVQFFPGYPYLERVLQAAQALLAPGGVLVLADLLDARLKEAFRQSLDTFRETHVGSEFRTKTHIDSEFYVDEGFLAHWGSSAETIAEIQIRHREGFQNELAYRFDAVLRKRHAHETVSLAHSQRHVWTGFHFQQHVSSRPHRPWTPDQLAYTIYTSGSTGVPKGVVLLHRPVVNLIQWVNTTYHVGPGDQLLFVTSLCFDLSVYDIFGILSAGATVRVASTDELRDPQRLVDILCNEPITYWDSAPAAMLRLTSFFPSTPQRESKLRLVFFSGDWIPVTLPDQVRSVFPKAQVIGLGGATEAAIWSNYWPIGEVDPDWTSIPYGRPIHNAMYYVLDGKINPQPPRVAGDLFIGGVPLASCYGGDPRKTAEKFIPNPYSGAGERLYRTGDLVRFWVDGTMEFLGRQDHQVKIRGFRVELGEIEAALRQHPELREAVVVAQTFAGDKRLVAYALPVDPAITPGESQLRQYLKGRIPEYMVPAHFVVLPQLPITANGKIDRSALPDPSANRPDLDAVYVAPRNPLERELARLWGARLGLERVGLDDNFFDLGGHSLMLADLLQDIKKIEETDLNMMDMFRHPTIRSLSARMTGVATQTSRETRVEARTTARTTAASLSDRRRASRGGR